MIHFIKILEYDIRPNDRESFNYIYAVASQEIDPPTLKPNSLFFDTPIVFHSPLRRAVECLKIRDGTRYVPVSLLKEIPFNIRKMCSKEEWFMDGSVLVRRKFKEHFVKNQLMMNRNEILEETKKFLARCYLLSKTSEISVVSHSFRMKIIEAFIRTKGRIEKEPSLIHDYINDGIKTFGFGEGFSVAEDDLSFSIL